MTGIERVLLASPRGFCAGVEMSVKSLAWMLDAFGPPVYCYHEIVHNQRVVDRFTAMGVRFVDDLDEVPSGAPLMLSAHGSAPELVGNARALTPNVVDAVCPLVAKVHHEVVAREREGYRIVYVGHKGHDEELGTTAIAPEAIDVVAAAGDLPADDGRPVAVLCQTTLSEDQYRPIEDEARRRYGDVWVPRRSDRCFATTNRQEAALSVAGRCDHFVVVGSPTSSNTMALVEVVRGAGCDDVQRVSSRAELRRELSGTVGVTSGASAPEETVREVVGTLVEGDWDRVEEVVWGAEDELFPAPPDLRRLAADLATRRADVPSHEFVSDPNVSASSVIRMV
jgi:4-hydroxy-3-methylbut-2-enyl diphosphate reductase